MGIVEIYFLGLIAHVGDNEMTATEGVIVHGKKHKHDASIHFSSGMDVPVDQGEDIIVGEPATAATSKAFRAFVPSLGTLCTPGSVLKRGVRSGTNHDDAQAYISYPAGNTGLDVGDLYDDGAVYVRPDFHHEQCVARLTVISVPTASELIVNVALNDYHVPPDSWLLIMNVGYDKSKDHFDEYKHITDAMLLALPTKKTMNCDFSNGSLKYLDKVQEYVKERRMDAATEIECSNSRFP